MSEEIKIIRPQNIEAIRNAETKLTLRLDNIGPIAERLQKVLGLDDPQHKSFFDLDIFTKLVGERVVGQLPNDGMGESIKTYTILGCVAGLVAETFKSKLAKEQNGDVVAGEKQDELLIQSLGEVFKNKCLVGPTSGSYGIALYIIAEKLREICGVEVKGLPLFGADIPSKKLEIIKRYHEREWGNAQIVEAPIRETREQVSLEKLLELVDDKSNTIDGGFFVPTNPASMADLEKLAATIIGRAESLNDVPAWKRDILSNLGIEVDTTSKTLTINTAYADHIAGTQLFAKAILESFPNAQVNVLYPISAGAGALGPLRQAEKNPDHMRVLLTADPANDGWLKHRTQGGEVVSQAYYAQPAAQIDGTVVKPSNGMGSTPQLRIRGDAVTELVEEGIENRRAEFLPVTDVMRQVARAIMTLDELHQQRLDKPVVLQELASATSAGALLTRAIETADDIRQLARLTAKEIFQHGFDEAQFLQLVVRDELRSETVSSSDAWDELKNLAELQGEHVGGAPNKIRDFMQELQNAFAEFSAIHGHNFHEANDLENAVINSASVTIIPITGRNSGIALRPRFVNEPILLGAKAA